MTEQGSIGMLFARKSLSENEASSMIESYANISKVLDFLEKERQTEALYREQLSQMDFLSLVTLKEQLNINSKSLIQNLRNANI